MRLLEFASYIWFFYNTHTYTQVNEGQIPNLKPVLVTDRVTEREYHLALVVSRLLAGIVAASHASEIVKGDVLGAFRSIFHRRAITSADCQHSADDQR